jgi:hypothetical protein
MRKEREKPEKAIHVAVSLQNTFPAIPSRLCALAPLRESLFHKTLATPLTP